MVKDQIEKALHSAFGEVEISLEIPENPDYGDYSTNAALKQKNPQSAARNAVSKLNKDKNLGQLIEKITIAGPGFVNFWLNKYALLENLRTIIKEGDNYPSSSEGKGKTVLIEYSSPNIAKRFGLGHLRSTIIGQAIYNLHKTLGYKVIGENHIGDWGTQFGVVLYAIEVNNLKLADLNIELLEKLYVDFNLKAKDNPKLWEEAKAKFKKLEEKDKEARKIWEKVREISLHEFEKVYSRLGIHIDHTHGESFYEDKR